MKDETVVAAIDWVIGASLAGSPEVDLLKGVCDRLFDGGLPILRVAVGSAVLHPTIDSRGYRWRRGESVVEEQYVHDSPSEAEWLKSPFRALVEGNDRTLRRQLDGDYRVGEFELLDTLKADGATDYFSLINRPKTGNSKLGASVMSWTIDRAGGYTEDELSQIDRISQALMLGYQSRAVQGTVSTLLETYLGRGAAQRVLDGNVMRGQADTIETVIWYSDLVQFTRIADEVAREHLLGLLNEYAEALVQSIEEHDGEVMKFVGDGILAIFHHADLGKARANALDAALRAETLVAALNQKRRAAGKRVTDFYLALHAGELLFGNFGSATRLDFTVLGPAVNEVSRIGGMCRSLDQRVMVSAAFAEAAGPRRRDLVSLGRYALRGVGQPQELFTIDRGARPR